MAAFLLRTSVRTPILKELFHRRVSLPVNFRVAHHISGEPLGRREATTFAMATAGGLAGTDVGSISGKSVAEITAAIGPPPERMRSKFCSQCGNAMSWGVPPREHSWRLVCGSCNYVDYMNPKLVVGCIVEHEGQVLLCRRAIEPCHGLWTVPAGFLELAESSAEGAVRETWEEAEARVEVLAPYAHFDIPLIGQAYILFRAKLLPPYTFAAGEESLEVALFDPADIPFDEIAFSSVSTALRLYVADLERGNFNVHHGVIDKAAGSKPNEPGSFKLKNHIAVQTVQPIDSSKL